MALFDADERVSISFSCQGGMPSGLPDFVEVKPRKSALVSPGRDKPFYSFERGVMPSGMVRKLLTQNRFSLQRVSVREKIYPDENLATVLTFAFFGEGEDTPEWGQSGMDMLGTMLQCFWKNIRIFKQAGQDGSPETNIVFSRRISPKEARLGDEDEWGLQKLVA